MGLKVQCFIWGLKDEVFKVFKVFKDLKVIRVLKNFYECQIAFFRYAFTRLRSESRP